jgi:Fur family transcriptional regulator, ferric uptake regulator
MLGDSPEHVSFGESFMSSKTESFEYELLSRTSEDVQRAHNSFQTYITSIGLRHTKQRRAILDAVLTLGPHVDAETIAAQARKIDTSIGLATVYRTLQLMTGAGLLTERQFGRERSQFEFTDGSEEHHDHLICNQCGVIVEFVDNEIETLQEKVASSLGFALQKHRMELYGDCLTPQNCMRRKHTPNGPESGQIAQGPRKRKAADDHR